MRGAGETREEIAEETQARRRDDTLCVHIFAVSATLVGVCLTVIGLFRALIPGQGAITMVDEALLADACLFLLAVALSYAGLRDRRRSVRSRLELTADLVFLTALAVMVAVCALIVYELV